MKKKNDYIAAIDLGSSKTTCIIAEVDQQNELEIIGYGNVNAKGLRKGMIINLEDALDSVKRAVEEAEMMSEVSIGTAFVGVAGTHIKSFNSTGAVAVMGKHGEVGEADISGAIEAAQTVSIPEEREIIHLIPMEFVIDGHSGITDPLGMTGSRLEVNVHIITGSVSSIKNAIKCINRAGIEVRDIVSNQLASAEAVLCEDEKRLGIAVADIGAGTTDLAVYIDGHLEYTNVLPIGGDHFTGDIAVGLRTPIHEAEIIKRKQANLDFEEQPDEASEIITIKSIGNSGRTRRVPSHLLNEVLLPRTEELISIIKSDLQRMNYDREINSGLVLTGGGALLKGLPVVAENILNLPVRVDTPQGIKGLSEVIENPIYSASVGILQYGFYNISSTPYISFLQRGMIKRLKDNARELLGAIF